MPSLEASTLLATLACHTRLLALSVIGMSGLGLTGVALAQDRGASPERILAALNEDYIRFVQTSDVAGFERLLADDFLCSNPDGSLVDRAGFLAQTARPVTITRLTAHDVRIRVLGDVAIVHARTSFTNADGSEGAGRYTDTYALRGGRWLAIAAHVTRVTTPVK